MIDLFSGFVAAVASLVHNWVEAYGLVGLFLASVVANATLFFPVPMVLVTFGLGGLASQNGWGLGFVVLVGLASGFGAAIGELSGYLAGFLGRTAIDRMEKPEKKGRVENIQSKIQKYGVGIIFICTFLPIPFDIVGLAAGLMKYNVQKFFIATACGKVLRDILIALAGYYGFALVQSIFF